MIEHFYKMNAKIIIFIFLVVCFTPKLFEASHNAAAEKSVTEFAEAMASASAELERYVAMIKSTGRKDAEDLVLCLKNSVFEFTNYTGDRSLDISFADITTILLDYGRSKNKEQVKMFFRTFLESELSDELITAINDYPRENIRVKDALRLFNRPLERRKKIVIVISDDD
ncbi:uncharacterized protein LOC126895364 isoform X1 [Daktulosphaira vitifoliae]|uniref:uncharacterized protein LOC126895364 isoform X1 n=1 Tax=Daktulosphaira vitifoliae TaxID=58002 RepID=UPI0021A9AFAA|nr:uncharacterized protein LOC126895364 isoform X1 [Daktulosphaira vitifoliae]